MKIETETPAPCLAIGDVVCIEQGPGVPDELRQMYWRVVAAEGTATVNAWKLEGPYIDAALTVRYHATPPKRSN